MESRGASISSELPLYSRLVPRLATVKAKRIGCPLSWAWKLVPKSTANAVPDA
jgi:hypothetical protein